MSGGNNSRRSLTVTLPPERVARARHFDQDKKLKLVNLIKDLSETRQFSVLGEPRINVFLLNLRTDSLK